MSRFPLSELAATPDVRQAKCFRKAANGLTGEQLAGLYSEHRDACRAAGQLAGELLDSPAKARGDAQQLAAALVEQCQKGGQALGLPDEGGIELLTRGVAASDGDAGGIELLGVHSDARLAVCVVRHVAPDSKRCSVGDTPLRALVEGLAACALSEAQDASIRGSLSASGHALSEEPPHLFILATPRYWELCRKREAQSGAGWISELERLEREIATEIGVSVRYLAVVPPSGDEAEAEEAAGAETQGAQIQVEPAWEPGAGKVKTRAKSKRGGAAVEEVIEADPSRPPRPYAPSSHYDAGDRIDHPTLGTGVVQRLVGPMKVEVLFEDVRRLLVQGRAAPTP